MTEPYTYRGDRALMERCEATLKLAHVIVQAIAEIRPKQEAWLRANYSITFDEACDSPESFKDALQAAWRAHYQKRKEDAMPNGRL